MCRRYLLLSFLLAALGALPEAGAQEITLVNACGVRVVKIMLVAPGHTSGPDLTDGEGLSDGESLGLDLGGDLSRARLVAVDEAGRKLDYPAFDLGAVSTVSLKRDGQADFK